MTGPPPAAASSCPPSLAPGIGARLAILGAALLFSTGGAAIKLSGSTPLQVAAMRSGVAALVLLALAREARRRPRGAREAMVPLAFGATMLLFVLANRTTTAAEAVLLQASAPLYVMVLGPRLLGEPLRRGDLLTLLGMALGLALVLAVPAEASATAPRPVLGGVLGAATGISWALTIVGLRWLGRGGAGRARGGGTPLSSVATGNALVALVVLPLAGWPEASPRELAVLLWLGGFQIAGAYLLVARGIARVPAFEASLLFLVEPVFSPLWAWLLHGEVLRPWTLAGGALILGCALRGTWRAGAHST